MKDKKKTKDEKMTEKTENKKISSFVRFFTPVSAEEFQSNKYSDSRKYSIFQLVSLIILSIGFIVTVVLSLVQIKRNVGTLIPTYQVRSDLHNVDF